MPIVEHPVFSSPKPGDGNLWRYTDLLKFLSLLNHSSLYLTNLTVMAELDPYEGFWPDGNYVHRSWRSEGDVPAEYAEALRLIREKYNLPEPDAPMEFIKSNMEKTIKTSSEMRGAYYINCWHLSGFESAAMWQTYSHKGFGIAIVSDVERMTSALRTEERKLYLGRVQYKDYQSYTARDNNILCPVVTKRNSFNYENEVRLFHWAIDQIESSGRVNNPIKLGIYVRCELETLIEKIVVSPYEPDWVFREVCKLTKHYGLRMPVQHSDLMKPPAW